MKTDEEIEIPGNIDASGCRILLKEIAAKKDTEIKGLNKAYTQVKKMLNISLKNSDKSMENFEKRVEEFRHRIKGYIEQSQEKWVDDLIKKFDDEFEYLKYYWVRNEANKKSGL